MRILVVEDDELVAKTLKILLTGCDYAVDVALKGEDGLQMVEAFEYDLIVLDLMLPDRDGLDLCHQLRSQGYQMPILLLTGLEGGHQKAVALNTGADDYVVKPFDSEELIARVQALLRRGNSISQPVMEWGDLRLDPGSHTVVYGSQGLTLTPKEYAILELFLRNPHRVLSSAAILDHVWSSEEVPGEETVRVHIKGLRQKLKAVGAPADFIETVYRVGYRLRSLHSPGESPTTLDSGSASQPVVSDGSTQSSVILVSDDVDCLAMLKNLLAPKHAQLMPYSHPPQFWEALNNASPDALVLDLDGLDGSLFELCQKVRQEPRWKGLPILFLLSDPKADLVHRVFAVGGDDFVSKPVVGPELVARLGRRLDSTKS
jgi:DNA-binding response OmpR family regulator